MFLVFLQNLARRVCCRVALSHNFIEWAAQITAKFGSRFDRVAIQKACTWLVNEGHAFEVTDNYFKSISAS